MFFKRNTDDPLDSVPTRRPGALLYVWVPFCAETRRFSGGDSRTRTYELRVMRTPLSFASTIAIGLYLLRYKT